MDMTYQEMILKMEEIFPGANVEADEHGQIIVYTGTKEEHYEK